MIREPVHRTTEILRGDAGKNLVAFLGARFTYQSESRWIEHIEAGRLKLNGHECSGSETLEAGDLISFAPDPYDEPPVASNFAILSEDDDFLFVDKPAPLPCHPGGIYLHHTLWGLLRQTHPSVSFVNRLDRETSGIVIAAKNTEAAAWAGALMSGRDIDKEYLALVEGDFPETLDAKGFLEPDTASAVRKKLRFIPLPSASASLTASHAGAKDCRTLFTLERRFPDGTSLVRAKLFTGRTHQIRATLQALAFPLVGDKLYGKDASIFLRFIEDKLTESDRSALKADRQLLHCSHIAFPKRLGGTYEIVSPAPFADGIPATP